MLENFNQMVIEYIGCDERNHLAFELTEEPAENIRKVTKILIHKADLEKLFADFGIETKD